MVDDTTAPGVVGWYYLHENGDLIFKHDDGGGALTDIRDSTFCRGVWPVDPRNRMFAWNLLVEALAAGARPERVASLASKWGCDDADALHYAERVGAVLVRDGDQWHAARPDFINLQESVSGFGTTALEALAQLAKELGYEPSTMWATTFKQLLEGQHG